MSNDQLTDLQELIINSFPSPIAINYKRIISKKTYEEKVRQLILTFEFSTRALGLTLVSQYLIDDRDSFSDSKLNKLLRDKLSTPSLGSWVEIVFTILHAYKKHPDRLFVRELYTVYWDEKNQKARKGIRPIFDELVTIRNLLAHRLPPTKESEWQELFERSHNLLLKIFGFLSFFANYELIYIQAKGKTEYKYQVYKGQSISTVEKKIPGLDKNYKGDGWFYLVGGEGKKQRHQKLYPFLVALEKDAALEIDGIQYDPALLDKFTSSRVFYLATLLWENFVRDDESLLADFFYNYEKSLGEKKHEKLSWENLKTTTQDITRQNIGDSIKKYDPALYLDRNEIRSVFEDFLASEKTCLVITGKSGVGKTNFVMATIESFREDQSICILAYNGARLPAEDSLSELLGKELENRIELTLRTGSRKNDVWGILSTIPGMNDKQVIVFIDALNENPNASLVLQKIDFLVGSSPYPWLKFVITSRPESWRVMNRKLKLAEHRYYWQQGEDEMGVELKEFSQTDPISLTVSINKFTRDEVNLAYHKYQAAFGLKTEYSNLTIEVRHALQDPLVLRLIAVIYKNASIPPTLNINQVYASFVDALISSGLLARKDIHFINQEIISRMADKVTNTLSEDDVMLEKGLYEAVFNTDSLSPNEQVNQSFVNLINTEILAPLPITGPTNISFKYERFYDYFLGGYYYQQYHNNPEKQSNYQKLAETIQSHPFLWGAVKNALIMEIENGQDELIFQLACQPNQLSRELAIATLTEYGQRNPDNANLLKILRRLLAVYKEQFGLGDRIKSYFSNKPAQKLDKKSRAAAMTALEVSRRLMLSTILEEAVQDMSQPIRVIAMRNIYYYWRLNRNKGFELLNRLAEHSTSKSGLPQTSAIEACIGISMLMMMHYNPHDEDGQEIGIQILDTWRRVIRRLLLISNKGSTGNKMVRSLIRNLAVSAITRFVVSTQENFPPSRPSFLRDVTFFFKADNSIKQRYERLVTFFCAPTDISNISDDLINTIIENDALTSFLVFLIINTEGVKNPEEILPLIEKMIEHALAQPIIGILPAYLIGSIGRIGLSSPIIDNDLYHISENAAKKYLEKTRGFFYSNIGSRHNNLALGEHSFMRHIRKKPEDIDLYGHFLKFAIYKADWEFLDALLLHDLIVIAYENPKAALESIKVLFPINNSEVFNRVAISLATIRVHHSDLVDDFLYEMDLNGNLYQHITRLEITEDPWSHLFATASGEILLNLLETPEIRYEFAWIMRRVTQEKNLESLLSIGIKRVINKMAGDEVFKVP